MSHPVYVRHSVHYIYDIVHTMYDITTSVSITPHSAYVWHHFHYRRRHIHSTTPSYNLYDFTSSSGMISHILYQTSHQLYLCHHNLSTDITPTFVWHHTHYMFDIICTQYNIIFNSYVITLLYLWQHNLTYETTSSMQFKIYTIHVTSQSLVCVITPTVLSASHPVFVWHHTRHRCNIFCIIEDITSSLYEIKPPFLWNHTHYIWPRFNAISVTTSTLLMISHQLHLCDLILYICWHHIHCIQQHIHYICTITATVPVSHTHCFHDITPFVYMTLHSLYV